MNSLVEIIIPVLNEEKILREKNGYYRWLKRQARIIFVDGGSTDRTVELARELAEVISSPAGRALQMNLGAGQGRSEYLLFLHVDTFLTPQGLQEMKQAFGRGAGGGCFTLAIDDRKMIFRVFEWLVNARARYFKIFDGDLGLFIRRDIFQKLEGFDRVETMEDILFSKKLRRQAQTAVLPEKIHASSRIWHEQGFLNTFLRYSKAYAFGGVL